MHSTALHILVMSAPKDILMTCKIFCIYSISKMFDTLIICRLYTTKHEAMSLLNCCTTLVCFVKTQKYHISNLIEFIKFSSHIIPNERVSIITECQRAPYIVLARCYRNYFYIWCLIQFMSLVERVPDSVLVIFFLHSAQLLCEQHIDIATLQEQRIVYKAYIHIKSEHSRLQIGLSSGTMLSTSW